MSSSSYNQIGAVTDNTGSAYRLFYASEVAETPALPIVFEGWTELLKKNLTFQRVHFGNKDSVIWIEDADHNIVSLVLFTVRKDTNDCWVLLTYTLPEHRGKGLNPKMLDSLKQVLKNIPGIKTISSNVFIENESALAAIKKTGRKIVAYRTTLDL